MQINRLFEIVYILFEKKTITAKELSQRFEVSQRTIYRDIDVLSSAGIPIYTNKGKGGGISILPEFVLNKSVLSDTEQKEILAALQSLDALRLPSTEPVLNKLAALFNKNSTSWIDVDFSRWGSDEIEKEKFRLLKNSILEATLVEFDYYSSYGEKSNRIVEPLKIVFKGQGWYLYGYCKTKQDYRMFKFKRMKNLLASSENFTRESPQNIWKKSGEAYKSKMVKLLLKVDSKMAYRLFDEFPMENIEISNDESFIVKVEIPEEDWIYGYIMSYGEYIEVLAPEHIRRCLVNNYKNVLKKYL